MLIEIAELDALPEGKVVACDAAGRSVAVVKWRDRVYAVRNVCPHQSMTFVEGVVGAIPISNAPGEIDFDAERPMVSCPWHHYRFDLETGQCMVDPGLRIKAYHLEIENGKVFVDLDDGHRRRTASAPEIPVRSP